MTENVIENPAPKSVAINARGQEEVAPKDWAGRVLRYQTEILEANRWQITERQRDIAYLSALEALDAEVLQRPLRGRGQPSPLYARTIHKITAAELRRASGEPAPVRAWEMVSLGMLLVLTAGAIGYTWWAVRETARDLLQMDLTLWLGPERRQTAANSVAWLAQAGPTLAGILLVPALVVTVVTIVRRARPRYSRDATFLAVVALGVCMATLVAAFFGTLLITNLGR
ncbi:MAG: hypothetical protein WAW17_10140 [Rhodococcus sp. (in: high G+C Gram-positive bacteria)]|uniref:hypothetical protein n=1 Tax=Rhodococcus sp. TaxID=1831 RepID=UPI003BB20A0B